MKKLFLGLTIIISAGILSAFYIPEKQSQNIKKDSSTSFVMPDSVKVVVDQSCYMCHNSNARGDAKDALNFDKLSSMKGPALVAHLQNIEKMVKHSWMPPRRFLSDHPEKALTEKQKQVLLDWVNAENNKLFSGN
ncbi:MAG: heme-binding domain-containing protein [Bacteroidales bacterium]|nr:heme-binding domain-containing protein [Bacteroidales bacterium]